MLGDFRELVMDIVKFIMLIYKYYENWWMSRSISASLLYAINNFLSLVIM